MKKIIMCLIITITITSTVNAAEVPRESAPCNATNEAIVFVESCIGDILTEVQNGLGYSDARAKSSRIFFNAWLNGQTSGYSYGELVDIANAAIWQYRDMYLRPNYYAQQEPVITALIADLITAVENGSMDYATARKEAYTRIYQSINPSYTPNTDIAADPIYLDIPAVDSAQFTIARKLLLEAEERSVTS